MLPTGCDRSEPQDEPGSPPAAIAAGPSVLLITIDTTRADHLSCYGWPETTSPNLDRLAERGVLFERAYVQASVTPVSHACILTGLHTYNHGLRFLHGYEMTTLPDSCTTAAEFFHDAGYDTAAFVSAFPVAKRFGLHQGFDVFDQDFLTGPEEGRVSQQGTINTGLNQRRADKTTDLALAWLKKQHDPFFMWVHYFDPHDPMVVPPTDFVDPSALTGTQQEKLRSLYDAEIRFMDQQIGRLFDKLDLDNTVIAVIADHGEGLGDHDWWTHGILYEEQIHVPMIVAAPSVPAGRRVPHNVRSIDLLPTILDVAGFDAQAQPAMDGQSLVPLFEPDAPDPGLTIYSDALDLKMYRFATLDPAIRFVDRKPDMLLSLIIGDHKYIHHFMHHQESELFDLAQDPDESHNLAQASPEIVMRMRQELQALDCLPKRPEQTEKPMSDEDARRLRSLGYVGGDEEEEEDDD